MDWCSKGDRLEDIAGLAWPFLQAAGDRSSTQALVEVLIAEITTVLF